MDIWIGVCEQSNKIEKYILLVKITRKQMHKNSLQNYIDIKTNIIQQLLLSGNPIGHIEDELGKADFDQISILIQLKSKNPLELIACFKPRKTICANGVISFDYSLHNAYCPIKINLINTNNIQMSQFYYSYGGLGYILSTICKSIGLNFSESGLRINLGKNTKEYLLISDSPEKICSFIGLNYNCWKSGFTNNDELFQWIMSTSYFSSGIFLKIGLSERKRSKQNVFYNVFLDYVQNECFSVFSEEKS